MVLELSYFFKSYSKNLIKETGGLRLEMVSRMVGHRKSFQNYAKLSLSSTGSGSQKKVTFIPSNVVDNIQEGKNGDSRFFLLTQLDNQNNALYKIVPRTESKPPFRTFGPKLRRSLSIESESRDRNSME